MCALWRILAPTRYLPVFGLASVYGVGARTRAGLERSHGSACRMRMRQPLHVRGSAAPPPAPLTIRSTAPLGGSYLAHRCTTSIVMHSNPSRSISRNRIPRAPLVSRPVVRAHPGRLAIRAGAAPARACAPADDERDHDGRSHDPPLPHRRRLDEGSARRKRGASEG